MNHYPLSEEDEAAILAVSAPALLNLLNKRLATTLRQLYGDYRQGIDLRPCVATYVAYVDLIRDIESKLNQRDYNNKEQP